MGEHTDKERLDWLEAQYTLHGDVEITYVVDGYLVQRTRDGSPVGRAGFGETLRDAIDSAMEVDRGE